MPAMQRGARSSSLFEALLWFAAAGAVILIALFVAGVFAWLLPVLIAIWLINTLNRISPPHK
jgi:hypothetical protein